MLKDRSAHNQWVAKYYDTINQDFLWVWTDRQSLALHFGYWEAHTRNHYEAQRNLNRILAERADLRPGLRVLDAGCGVGGSAIWLAQQYQVQVLGITLSPTQVRRAQGYAAKRSVARQTTFARLDYTALALHESTFDVVWALESVCHARNKSDFLAEAFRVLRPGGRLVVADGFRRTRPASAEDEHLLQSWLLGWAIPDIDTPAEFLAVMRAVGFSDIQFDDVTERIQPSMQRLDWLSLCLVPPARLLRRVGLLSPIRVDNGAASAICCEALRRGLTLYGLVSGVKP